MKTTTFDTSRIRIAPARFLMIVALHVATSINQLRVGVARQVQIVARLALFGTKLRRALAVAVLTAMGAVTWPTSAVAAVINVLNTNDSGSDSLRGALASAMSGDTIDATGVSGTILLTSGDLFINKNLTILGPGPATLAVDGNAADRVFFINAATVHISGLTITNGFGSGSFNPGGGIWNLFATLVLSNCTVSGNSSQTTGGGLFNDRAAASIIDSTFDGNTAKRGGGIALQGGATLVVINSTLSRNSSSEEGGAIHAAEDSSTPATALVQIVNSTISGNMATNSFGLGGGGVFVLGTGAGNQVNVQIVNTTIANNSAKRGGGIVIFASSPAVATVELGNTILRAGASGGTLTNSFVGGSFVSHGYNLSSDGANGFLTNATDHASTNPKLGPLQDNGGPTFTHALLPGSPAIDQGTNFVLFTTDQRGEPRPVDDLSIPNAAGGDGSDIGAYEACPETWLVINTNDSGPGSLRQAILDANACPGNNIIDFAPSAYGTITLTNGELLITGDVDILGPGATNVAVNGNYPNTTNRVFHITPGVNVTIAGLTITNAYVAGFFPAGDGAGIFNFNSRLTVSNCTITGNSASSGGGIHSEGRSGSATLSIVNSTLSGNSAGGGGGIGNYAIGGHATLEIVNSTLSGNSAGGGGGIHHVAGMSGTATLTIRNSTLSDNTAGAGGGIRIFRESGSALVTIGSTILNASGITNEVFGVITSLGYNLSSDDGGGFLNQSTDQTNTPPLLGPLQLNGGQTPTHALLCGSPAIDAGTNFTASAIDQTGFPRTFDVPTIANVGDGTDIGAFEVLNNSPVALCTNATVSANSNCEGNASINNGSNDPDGDTITTSQSPAGPYSLGTHTVTLTVTDCHGAANSCTATVTVVDTTPLNIASCAPPQTNSANASCQAEVPNFTGNVTASDNCPVKITQAPAAGTLVGLGTTNVTIYVVDSSGNTNTCTTSFTVKDTTPPSLTCPGNQIVNATGPTGAIVNTYSTPTTSDNCGSVNVSYSPVQGTLFPIGDTTVNVTATDSSGNSAIPCSFKVQVKGAAEQINDLIAKVNALPGVKSPNKTALVTKLRAALAALASNKTNACAAMQDFINLVKAQKDKKLISVTDATSLTIDATRIRAVIGCP